MVPDTRLRLKAVLKALEEVIDPAMPEDALLAREQLGLIQKTIALVMAQAPLECVFMISDTREDLALARHLASSLAPGHALRCSLESCIARTEAALPASMPDTDAVRALWIETKEVVEGVVDRLFASAPQSVWESLGEIIVAYSEKRNLRERAWAAETGFDPDPGSLPSLRKAATGEE